MLTNVCFFLHNVQRYFSKLRVRTITNIRQKEKLMGKRLLSYSIYAWGVPLSIVIIGQILDNIKDLSPHIVKPGFGIKQCWFGKSLAYHWQPKWSSF